MLKYLLGLMLSVNTNAIISSATNTNNLNVATFWKHDSSPTSTCLFWWLSSLTQRTTRRLLPNDILSDLWHTCQGFCPLVLHNFSETFTTRHHHPALSNYIPAHLWFWGERWLWWHFAIQSKHLFHVCFVICKRSIKFWLNWWGLG